VNEPVIIKPLGSFEWVDLRELIASRHLMFLLAWRDVKVMYVQTYLGIAWSVITPLISIFVLNFVFQKVAKTDTGDVQPFLFTMCGYVAWSYFSKLVNAASTSLINAQSIIQKVYFPRLVLPLSKAVSGLVDLLVLLTILGLAMLYHDVQLRSTMLLLPFVLFMLLLTSLSVGVWLSAVTVRYRDFRFVTPFLLQVGLFVTPVAYPLSQVPGNYTAMFMLNPMVGIIESFRYCLLGVGDPLPAIGFSVFITLFMLLLGLYYFSKVEKVMSDII